VPAGVSYLRPLAAGHEGIMTIGFVTTGLLKTSEARNKSERLDSTKDRTMINECKENGKRVMKVGRHVKRRLE
jgi:S-adenosylmethionine:tRNA-ribosyltransferase-isomerase (queuine synthetase)